MCGIVGLVQPNDDVDSASNAIFEMTAALSHRGPDEQGIWQSHDRAVSLGHRRLSIIDLSPAGSQPFRSKDNNFVLVFNGEIYNHRQLREELQRTFAINFEGTSDTEVLFYALVHWGVVATLPKLRGMFAFGFYSRKDATIFLARDRAGEKPLYFGCLGESWGFSSELKAMSACPSFEKIIDEDALATFFNNGYIPAPFSIWRGIRKLKPCSYLVYDLSKRKVLKEESYWCALPQKGREKDVRSQNFEAQIHHNLIQAIDEQLVADVPVGAFLSGGIDSSLVVSIVAAELGKDIKTFSIGFEDKSVDESAYASRVASQLCTNHANWVVTADDALKVIPKLPRIFDEPFGDPSAVPTVLVSYFARKDVTVTLSGDGADELFAGYSRYHNPRLHAAWRLWIFIRSAGGRHLPSKLFSNRKLAALMKASSFNEFYAAYTAQWVKAPLALDTHEQHFPPVERPDDDFYNQMRAMDFNRYLPDCILTKVDRSSMAHSLETRVPFLDVRVIETAFAVDAKKMVRAGSGKLALKNILATYLPRYEFNRPKKGFSIPLAQWLLHDLRELSDYYLSEAMLKKSGLLDYSSVTLIWEQLKSGREEYQQPIWLVLIFQLWFEENFS